MGDIRGYYARVPEDVETHIVVDTIVHRGEAGTGTHTCTFQNSYLCYDRELNI